LFFTHGRNSMLFDASPPSLNNLRRILDEIEEALAAQNLTELGQAVHLASEAAEATQAAWTCSRNEALKLADKQGEAIVNAGMMTIQVQEAKEALELEIVERRKAEALLSHQALHDPLTGLPNRHLLTNRINACIERSRRMADYRFAVLFLDVDNFKLINDSLGHDAGDMLLVELGRRLAASLPSTDTVCHDSVITARLGGDEFVVLLDDVRGEEDAVFIAEKIRREVADPLHLPNHDLITSVSIGIALSDSDDRDTAMILRDADTAMYQAKQAGKDQYAVFRSEMHADVRRRLTLESEMRSAIEREQLRLMYQPIISLHTGNIVSFEALLRWRHPQLGSVSPGEFVPIAEETGMIVPMGDWALEEACRQLQEWNVTLPPERKISINVNVSGRQLVDQNFARKVEEVIQKTGGEASHLNMEITESVLITARQPVLQQLKSLRTLGVHIQMDDFGTGYSSLSCLSYFPLDTLKIDKAFVKNHSIDRDYIAIMRAIITLAKDLGMQVTIEGVENEAQLAMIQRLDCDCAQGYLFSRPLPPRLATTLLAKNRNWRATSFSTQFPKAYHGSSAIVAAE
jgi:diguanylate cyclase (GGDEF)-like protein